jgi:membrane associated rhomboid family serine protease
MNGKRGASTTLILIIINVIAFMLSLVLLYFNPKAMDYIGVMPSRILAGGYIWTLITSIFMHASPTHLFMNMVSLAFMGGFLERILGKRRFLIFYLSAGIFASIFFVLVSMIFQTDINVMAVGASGAIFGIAGLLAVLTPKLKVYIMFIPVAIEMWLASIIILGLLWFLSLVGGLPIGNTAHLGGLIAGLIYGTYLRKKYPRKIQLLNRYLMLNS